MDFDNPRVREAFFAVYEGIPRGGPGDTACTLRALEAASPLPPAATIADFGCGPGPQTLVLAEHGPPDATIVAIDNHPPFVAMLDSALGERQLRPRVTAMVGDMTDPPFDPASLDLIWSEGAAYFMGSLGQALVGWRPLLREGGVIAVTEATWLRGDPPAELRRFWDEEYPGMCDVDGALAQIDGAGFDCLERFTLPESTWLVDFFGPMEQRLDQLERQHATDDLALAVFAECRDEIETYRRHSDTYGYTFFVMRAR